MKKVIVTTVDKDKGSGGNKAKQDIRNFLKSNDDFSTFDMSIDGSNKLYKLYFINTKLRRFIKQEKPNFLAFQYPSLSFYVMNKLVQLYRSYVPNGHLVFIIHDIMGWQFAHRTELLNKEITLFNQTDGLVVHNEKMKQFLKQHGVEVPMSNLQLFDYANQYDFAEESDRASICFAGNLGKSKFLNQLSISTPVSLYGSNPSSDYAKNISYKGQYPANEIPNILKESFGLVWDGDRVDTCSGSLGEYLKINNPHKASLYLSAGIPIIVWSESALADIVDQYGVGIAVSDLNNIDKILADMDQQSYSNMKQNAENIGLKLKQGYFIQQAIRNIEQKLAIN